MSAREACSPGGAAANSPVFQRRVRETLRQVPEGTTERPSPKKERDSVWSTFRGPSGLRHLPLKLSTDIPAKFCYRK